MVAGAHDIARPHGPLVATGVSMSMLDRCYAVRDKLLGNSIFQRFSASFPLTRPIADKQARALFDLCAGFVYSQILAACVRLDLFKRLASGPKSISVLSRELALSPAATERLLLAALSLRLVSRRGQRFGLGMLGAALNGNPGIAAMIAHHDMLYRDLEDPVGLLRCERKTTDLGQYWPYARTATPAGLGADDVGDYSALMSASQSFIARDVLDAYPFGRHRCLLDIGGGEGAFIAAAADRFPKLNFVLFDLPAVADRARQRIAAAHLEARVTIRGGSFKSDALPQGADIVSLVRLVHDHDDETVMVLLRAIHQVLPPGGGVLVAEPMAGVTGAEPVGDAYFGMYLLAMGQGRPRRPAEIAGMLQQAGFVGVTARPTRRPMLVGLVSGSKP